MLKRKAYRQLIDWKRYQATNRKALLVTGARQIGKSFLIRQLGIDEYRSLVEINLLEDRVAARSLVDSIDAQDFINRLALLSNSPLLEGDTLVFIDEIQEAPDIMTFAKFLVEDGRFDYAFSGSMLGTEFKGVRSFPVGYVHELTMYPLDFEEFCWAVGVTESALSQVKEAFLTQQPVDDYVHDALISNFRSYCVIGGMPEVVQRFVDEGGSLVHVRELQSELNRQYSYDITKYAGSQALSVREIFDELPVQLKDEKGRFIVTSLGKDARYQRYQQDFLWLVNAGVGLKVDRVTEPKPPLRRTRNPASFKLYQSDTGMLIARYSQGLARAVYLDDRAVNVGAIFENVVAQQLVAQGFDPFYFQTRKVGEVDFLIEAEDGIVALEVKSGNDYFTHASLSKVMTANGYDVAHGIVLCRSNFQMRDGVLYAPWYATIALSQLSAADGLRIETHQV